MTDWSQGSAHSHAAAIPAKSCVSDRDLRSAHVLARSCGTRLYPGSSSQRRRRGRIRTAAPKNIRVGPKLADVIRFEPPARVRLELPRLAHAGVAAWYSDIDYLIQVQIAYDLYYPTIRPALADRHGRGGVGKDAVVKVAASRAAAADWETGRNSRLSVATIMARTGLGERTVQRATAFLRLIGAATEVLRGRQRTKTERMASWRLGDRGRGWASVYALHPPNNPQVRRAKLDLDPHATPHPRRGPFRDPSSLSKNSLSATGKAGENQSRASRDSTTTTRDRCAATRHRKFNQRGLVLAHKWRQSGLAPAWLAKCSPGRLSAVLAKPAEHGWTPADLDQLLRDHVSLGGWLAADPNDPVRLLGWLLKKHGDLEDRPAAAEEARAAELRRAAAIRRRAIELCTRCGEDGFINLGHVVVRCDHANSDN